jgi:dTDP-L-rhamnose 4-epimerase
MKKILITGGAGFIGSRITEILYSKKDYEVTILDSLSEQIHGMDPKRSVLYKRVKDKCNFIKGDVTSNDLLEKAIYDADIVVHLAAETGTGQSMYEISKYVNVNSLGTANILNYLVHNKHKVQKLIVASSRAIYGEGKYQCAKHGIVYPKSREVSNMKRGDFECKCPICTNTITLKPTDEDSKKHPTSVYGITKLNQEQLIMNVCKSIDLPAVSFRYQNVYGPGQSLSNPYTGILSIFSALLLNRKEINIFEDGKESRDFVFIDDVAEATISGIENDKANFEIFNVGTGIGTTVLEVAESLAAEYHSDMKYKVSGDFRAGDIRHNIADIAKISKTLDYIPKISFRDGIERFSTWVLNNTDSMSEKYFSDSLQEMKEKKMFYEG